MRKYKVLTIMISVCIIHTVYLNAQSIDWNLIDGPDSPIIEAKLNGLNMGGYTYGAISQQGGQVSILDECVQCVDFDCSPFLNQALIAGKEYNSSQPKELFLEKSRELKPSVLRFPGGTHSGWYHFYKYDDDGFYDATNPKIAKGYGMNLAESIHLPNAYSYCQRDTRLTIDSNYIQTFVNYVQGLKKDQPQDYKLSVSYVANIFTHFRFPQVDLPLIGSCTSTCGRGLSLEPMKNYNCEESFEMTYEGNEDLFDNDPAVYRFELYYKETQDAIAFLAEELNLEKEEVLFVELGNEYYNNDGPLSGYSYEKYGMNAKRYAHLAEIYSERLKCFFANKLTIETAIVSKPNTNWQSTSNTFKANYPGLANLMDEDVNGNGQSLNDVIDGVILHDYYTSNECSDFTDIQESFECARQSFSEHIHGDEGIIKELDNFKNNFTSKSIWLTEWNIVGGNESKNLAYLNTALHTTFVQEYMLKLYDYNAQNNNLVKLAHHHRIGFDLPWSVIQVKDGDNSVAIERAAALPLRYLSEIRGAESSYFHGNILKDNGEIYDESKATVYAISKENNQGYINEVILYYTNKTNEEISFNLPMELQEIEIVSATNVFIHGAELFSYGPSNGTHGRNRFHDGNSNLYDEELNSLGFGSLHDALQKQESYDVNINETQALKVNSTGLFRIVLKTPIAVESFKVTEQDVKIKPNPFADYFNIEAPNNLEILLVEVFNQNGQLITSIKGNKKEDFFKKAITTSKLLSGIYWCKITTNEGVVIKKGIKI